MKDPLDIGFARKSLPAQIADVLRQSIIDGSLPAGTRLLEIELAQHFSVSRAALREALWTLQSEGLIESRPNRGSYVAQLGEADIVEIYSLRSVLEGLAARLVAQHATSEQFATLQSLVDAMVQSAQTQDYSATEELDMQFHRAIWNISGHRRLIQMLTSMQTQIQAFLSVNAGRDADWIASIRNHQALLDILRVGDPDAAEQAMRQHIQQSITTLSRYLQHIQTGDSHT